MNMKMMLASLLFVSPMAFAAQQFDEAKHLAQMSADFQKIMNCKAPMVLEVDASLQKRLTLFSQKSGLKMTRTTLSALEDRSVAINSNYLRRQNNDLSVRLVDDKGSEVSVVDTAKLDQMSATYAKTKVIGTDIFKSDEALAGKTANAVVAFEMINKFYLGQQTDINKISVENMSDDQTGQSEAILVPVSLLEVKRLSQKNLIEALAENRQSGDSDDSAITPMGDLGLLVAITSLDSLPDEAIAKAHEMLLSRTKTCK